jgi:small subunit ribosomal protein S6
MRRYETFVICDPDLSAEQRAPVLDRINEQVGQFNGFMVEVDEWGSRKMAYTIKKKMRGYYVRLDYCGSSDLVNEMERFFRIDDRVMKYMTVVSDREPDIDAVKEEMAAAEKQRKEAAAAAAEAKAAAEEKAAEASEAEAETSAGASGPKTEAQEAQAQAAKPAAPADTEAAEKTAGSEPEAQPEEPQKEVE